MAALAAQCIVVCSCKAKKKALRENPDTDENDTYGTYARGFDGEGEYGDGDVVEIVDNNDLYGGTGGAEAHDTNDLYGT